ncbi:MAG: aminotransferase class I/II-fold pyridoxal phosphate-dependent enzyme [Dehalococcoidia bacterium]|nr:aminotransferase class I/II-fold pyridoxal phosphate-dependent enzyme [Dehalococcoidia bacterium]
MISRLARHLAAFYAGAATGEHISGFARPEAILGNWQENFAQTLPYVGRTIGVRTYLRLVRGVYANLLRLHPLWQERLAAGHIRDGHGDLRCSAVCFEDAAIQVYDCIEFNERFRYGDVAADVAFLAMDLDHHGRADLAWHFVDAYRQASGDHGLAALLELARYFKANPPKRSVLLLVTSGHFQGMAGMREFMDARFRDGWAITGGRAPVCFFTLDISGGWGALAAHAQGWWLRYRMENFERERGIVRALRDRTEGIARTFGKEVQQLLVDAVNNPDGREVEPSSLLDLAARRSGLGRWTVVDESFVETRPELSIANAPVERLVVLRSFGKFYGLPGVRLGFVIAQPQLIERLRASQGDWPVSADAVSLGVGAYQDEAWANETRERLRRDARAADEVLSAHGFTILGGTSLFRLVSSPRAGEVFEGLCRRGILTRPFEDAPDRLRIGTPRPDDLARLADALKELRA